MTSLNWNFICICNNTEKKNASDFLYIVLDLHLLIYLLGNRKGDFP